jgi:hypothetical protein
MPSDSSNFATYGLTLGGTVLLTGAPFWHDIPSKEISHFISNYNVVPATGFEPVTP